MLDDIVRALFFAGLSDRKNRLRTKSENSILNRRGYFYFNESENKFLYIFFRDKNLKYQSWKLRYLNIF